MAPPESAKLQLVATVRGRVQGVGFRYFVLWEAQRLGLRGYVRNQLGGRGVEVVAEGGRADLNALVARLRIGPPVARVDAVEKSWLAAQGGFPDFRIRA